MKKSTQWFTIARAGKTLNKGFNLTEKHLSGMAESYDPEIYHARIWPEHRKPYNFEYLPALGYVSALRTNTASDGTMVLQAQIEVNDFGLWLNRNDRKTFTSIEMIPKFPQLGKPYLYGLAFTDSPASLGTERIQLSVAAAAEDDDPFWIMPEDSLELNLETVDNSPSPEPDKAPDKGHDDMNENQEKNLAARILSLLTTSLPGQTAQKSDADEALPSVDETIEQRVLSIDPAAFAADLAKAVALTVNDDDKATNETSASDDTEDPEADEQIVEQSDLREQVTALSQEIASLPDALRKLPSTSPRALSTGGEASSAQTLGF